MVAKPTSADTDAPVHLEDGLGGWQVGADSGADLLLRRQGSRNQETGEEKHPAAHCQYSHNRCLYTNVARKSTQ